MCFRLIIVIIAMQVVYLAATTIASVAMGRSVDGILMKIFAAVSPSA
jgi:hypothetical protein